MKMMMAAVLSVLLWVGIAVGQNSSQGTVNSMSSDPEQNQKLTGTMGTTTGQPNDVTPGSANNPNGQVPMTQPMSGSDSNGDINQKVPGVKSNAKQATPHAAAATRGGSNKGATKHTASKKHGSSSQGSAAEAQH